VRSDETQSADDFRRSRDWQVDPFTRLNRPEIDRRYADGTEEASDQTRWHSFSGHERNSFFLNAAGQRFVNVSALSGLDNVADSRSWVRWDFDRDGLTDVALVNANYPGFNLYRNQSLTEGEAGATKRSHFVALQFRGANLTRQPSDRWSARDAFGARVTVRCGDRQYLRAHTCGEGFAAQNSATLLIGIVAAEVVDELTVVWPSVIVTRSGNIAADQCVQAYETADISPHNRPFDVSPYRPTMPTWRHARVTTPLASLPRELQLDLPAILPGVELGNETRVLFFTTTATWCEACHRLQPELRGVVARFAGRAQFFGVPVDPIETPAELAQFASTAQPAYRLLSDLPSTGRDAVTRAITRLLNTESIPCTLATDRAGRVLQAFLGVPTASDVGRLVASQSSIVKAED